MGLTDYILHNKEVYRNYSLEFLNLFGVYLNRFWSPLTGFDIVAFDEYMETPDGVSLKEYVKTRYGDRAVVVIEKLIG